jgi:predicted short-subunit dehydrogenase-like oxidoreductase (DUF2520 family)
MRLGILGGGRAAWAYGSAWAGAGWPITGVWLRPESRSRLPELLTAPRRSIAELAGASEVLLVAVSDRAISEVVTTVPATDAIVFHASGALPSPRDGFSLHPLKSLPPVGEEVSLRDSLLVFEGAHRKTAKLIAAAMGARFAEVSAEQKPLYHAAAVFGSNYVAAMLDIAEAMMRESGIPEARPHLVALALSAIRNWEAHDGANRFTGPAVRRDEETLRRHMAALGDHAQVADMYKLLADWIASGTTSKSE